MFSTKLSPILISSIPVKHKTGMLYVAFSIAFFSKIAICFPFSPECEIKIRLISALFVKSKSPFETAFGYTEDKQALVLILGNISHHDKL